MGNESAAAHAPPTMALAESGPVRRGETTIPISETDSVTRTDEVAEPKPRMPQARSPGVRSSGSLGTGERFVKTLAQSNSNGEKAIPAPQRRPPRKDVYSRGRFAAMPHQGRIPGRSKAHVWLEGLVAARLRSSRRVHRSSARSTDRLEKRQRDWGAVHSR